MHLHDNESEYMRFAQKRVDDNTERVEKEACSLFSGMYQYCLNATVFINMARGEKVDIC